MMAISFVNIGLVVLLVNMNFGYDFEIPLLQGRYDEFSVEWYRLVGSAICVQMALMIFTQHGANSGFQILGCCKRCSNRGCRLSAKHTNSLSQEDYEDVNVGSDPCMDYKYASMLTVVFVTMLYGSGIPILYLISAVFFFATYWVDKILIFYYYRKPELLDENLATRTLYWFKYALLLHVIGAICMYSNSDILPDKEENI